MPILNVNNIHTYYGNIHALKGITITVEAGEVVTLIGSNGAGKSTTLKTISGIMKPRTGSVSFKEKRIDMLPPNEVVQLGIAQSPEGRRIFPRMTVVENLEMGAYARKDRAQVRADMDRVFELFPRLKERTTQKGGTMSGGEQQMLAIGRALMAKPRLLLLDEPSLGLAPKMVQVVVDAIRVIAATDITILLVEQNTQAALSVATRGYVMAAGRIVYAGGTEELRQSPEVRDAFIGGKSARLAEASHA